MLTVAAKITGMRPVLVVTFQAQQIAYVINANWKIVKGNPVIDSDPPIIIEHAEFSLSLGKKSIKIITPLYLIVIQSLLILFPLGSLLTSILQVSITLFDNSIACQLNILLLLVIEKSIVVRHTCTVHNLFRRAFVLNSNFGIYGGCHQSTKDSRRISALTLFV